MANKAITPQQRAELQEAFRLFDKNGDGKISSKELKDVMTQLGQKPTDKEVADMIKSVDQDHNGTIEFDEFVQLMADKLSGTIDDAEMLAAFKQFDKNGDGKITKQELKEAMHNLGQKLSDQEIEEMIKGADKNNDGSVDYKEFVAMMKE